MSKLPGTLPLHQRLTFRIVVTTLLGLSLTLTAIAYTLILSWQLEGGAAAINEAGSLRMRSYRLALLFEHSVDAEGIAQEIQGFEQTLHDLRHGDASRPLFLPTQKPIREQMDKVEQIWRQQMQQHALKVLQNQGSQAQHDLAEYRQALGAFVEQINRLVSMVEVELAGKTTLLRLSQTALIFLALAASVAMLYLLYLWIIEPVSRLQTGIARMSADDLSVRITVESQDEFGELANAFNRMADHIQTAQRTLEQRVHEKTQKLQAQNHEVSTLYEIAGFLANPLTIEELCRGFLRRIMARIQADGGTVRILDELKDNMHISVHEGLSEQMVDEEHCIKKDECLCGASVTQGIILVRDFRQLNQQKRYRCKEEGFFSLAIFPITVRQQVIGSYSLHFRHERDVSSEERRLLETLGHNLGVAIENQRLIAKEKEFAVSHERNLLAQGLHDSIAQGLNFLNLQVQMLEDSLQRQASAEIAEILPLLRTGIEESYQDVRELLQNFRTRLQETSFDEEMRNLLSRFQRQTGIAWQLDSQGSGAPLAPEQQLQVLFILQEALSNIRKHAQASLVSVVLNNQRDFHLQIYDDGRGFNLLDERLQSDSHIGLKIMHERAASLGAQLELHSKPGAGTRIELRLLREERLIA